MRMAFSVSRISFRYISLYLKQKQVAEDLICDQSLYSKYERGERPLPLDLADRLADYFGTSVDYLLGRTDEKKPYPKSKRK